MGGPDDADDLREVARRGPGGPPAVRRIRRGVVPALPVGRSPAAHSTGSRSMPGSGLGWKSRSRCTRPASSSVSSQATDGGQCSGASDGLTMYRAGQADDMGGDAHPRRGVHRAADGEAHRDGREAGSPGAGDAVVDLEELRHLPVLAGCLALGDARREGVADRRRAPGGGAEPDEREDVGVVPQRRVRVRDGDGADDEVPDGAGLQDQRVEVAPRRRSWSRSSSPET